MLKPAKAKKKMVPRYSGGMMALMDKLTPAELQALVDFPNSVYYSAFAKMSVAAKERIVLDLRLERDYPGAASKLAQWQLILNYWESILTLHQAALVKLAPIVNEPAP